MRPAPLQGGRHNGRRHCPRGKWLREGCDRRRLRSTTKSPRRHRTTGFVIADRSNASTLIMRRRIAVDRRPRHLSVPSVIAAVTVVGPGTGIGSAIVGAMADDCSTGCSSRDSGDAPRCQRTSYSRIRRRHEICLPKGRYIIADRHAHDASGYGHRKFESSWQV